MANARARAYGGLGADPKRGPRAEPLVIWSGSEASLKAEAESLVGFERPTEAAKFAVLTLYL